MFSHAGQSTSGYYLSQSIAQISRIQSANNVSTQTAYHHRDHLGSTIAISTADGRANNVQHISYDPWGKGRTPAWVADPHGAYRDDLPRYGFTGHEMLVVVGFIHMNGRVYDPMIGRFLSADPHVQFAGNLQSYNRYAYVSNNPLSHTDPTGYFMSELSKNILQNISPQLAGVISIVLNFIPFCQGWCSAIFNAMYAYANGATGSQIAFAAAVSYIGGQAGGAAASSAASAGATVVQQSIIQGAVSGAVSGGITAMVHGGNITRGIVQGAVQGAAMGALISQIQNSVSNRVAGETRSTGEGKQIRLAANGSTREEIDAVLGMGWEETLGGGNSQGTATVVTVNDPNDWDHSAVHIKNGKKEVLYDPAGVYYRKTELTKSRVIVKSGVWPAKSSGDLIDILDVNTIFKFHSGNHFGKVLKPAQAPPVLLRAHSQLEHHV